jgi:hypothetical protein
MLTGCKFTKVTRRQRCSVVIQPEDDAANVFAVDRNFKLCEKVRVIVTGPNSDLRRRCDFWLGRISNSVQKNIRWWGLTLEACRAIEGLG